MFNDEVYEKAESLLERITELNKNDIMFFKKGYILISVEILSDLKKILNELVGIKSKTYSQKEDQITEEDKFFASKGYRLIRILGLAIYLFKDDISLPKACFELLVVAIPFRISLPE